MSAEQLLDGSASETPLVTDHEPDTECDSRVYVNGTRIPVATVDVHLRKEGPLDVTRYAEVEFPAEFQGQPYVELFRTIDPETQSSFDELYIELKGRTNDEWKATFRGVVTGVGATDSAGIWQCRAQGAGQLAGNVSADTQFTKATGKDVVDYVTDTLSSKVPFAVTSPSDSEDNPLEELEISKDITSLADFIFPENESIPDLSPKAFQGNRHVLADVLTWLRSKTGLRLWFEPTSEGVVLLPLERPTDESHTAHYLGGDVEIITNKALSELAPINTLTAKGKASESLDFLGEFEFNLSNPNGTYYVAKARHKGLYERAGGVELAADTFIKSDGQTASEVENDATDALKAKIDEATLGDMATLLHGGITPFDTIEAQPTCADNTVEDTVPITYEVSRVHHQVNPQDGVSRSMLNVGIHTDIEEDIEIVASYEDGGV